MKIAEASVLSGGVRRSEGARRAVVLPLVMAALLLMGLLVAGFAFRIHADVVSTDAAFQRVQTRLAAEAGIEQIKLMLRYGRMDFSSWYDNPDQFHRIIVWVPDGDETTLGTNKEFTDDRPVYRFSIVADDPTDDKERIRFGITDEASRLNLNVATADQLRVLVKAAVEDDPKMDVDELVGAIIDWRDTDHLPLTADGDTEGPYYEDLDSPIRIKNAPFDTVEELLLVKGMTRRILYGEDDDQNGVLTANEMDGEASYPMDNSDDKLNRGIYPYLTTVSYEVNTSNDNHQRVYLLGPSEAVSTQLAEVFPDNPDVVGYIMSRISQPGAQSGGQGGQGGQGGRGGGGGGMGGQQSGGAAGQGGSPSNEGAEGSGGQGPQAGAGGGPTRGGGRSPAGQPNNPRGGNRTPPGQGRPTGGGRGNLPPIDGGAKPEGNKNPGGGKPGGSRLEGGGKKTGAKDVTVSDGLVLASDQTATWNTAFGLGLGSGFGVEKSGRLLAPPSIETSSHGVVAQKKSSMVSKESAPGAIDKSGSAPNAGGSSSGSKGGSNRGGGSNQSGNSGGSNDDIPSDDGSGLDTAGEEGNPQESEGQEENEHNPMQQAGHGNGGAPVLTSPADLMLPNDAGPSLIPLELLPTLMDRTTTVATPDLRIKGLININTAPPLVLKCLPTLTDEQIAAIVEVRDTLEDEERATTAWLVTSSILTIEEYAAIAAKITAKPQQFRIESLGYGDHTGMITRLEVVLEMAGPVAQTTRYRDLSAAGGRYPIREEDLRRVRGH